MKTESERSLSKILQKPKREIMYQDPEAIRVPNSYYVRDSSEFIPHFTITKITGEARKRVTIGNAGGRLIG